MSLKKFDFISPYITLYFKGEDRHSSIFSGILTIILYILVFGFSIYYTIIFVNKSNPTIYFYNRYVSDAGIFPFNSSSLFHFIRFADTINNENKEIDFESVTIFGIEESIDEYMSVKKIKNFNHWLYGECNINDAKNIEKVESLVNQKFPEKAACIRQYYDKNDDKYYDTNQENFKWPALTHGCANENAINYGIIIEKCTNSTINKICKSNEEIENYFDHLFFIAYFMDQFVDVLNYKTPYIKYLYKLTNGFFQDTFTINHLNFNPSRVTSHNGIFIDNQVSDKSYQYTQNEKININKNDTTIVACCYFWMQNTLQYYQRNYERFQDLLSNIGGISSFICILVLFINDFVCNFIILLDTEELVINIDKQNFKKVQIQHKPTILRKASEILNPPKFKTKNKNNINKNNNGNTKQSSIIQILQKDKINLSKISNNKNARSETSNNCYPKRKGEFNLNKNLENKNLKKNDNNFITQFNNEDDIYNENKENSAQSLEKNIVECKSMGFKYSSNDLITEARDDKNKPITKQNFTWFNYIYYSSTLFFCWKSINPKIYFYENFRRQIISEENMIQNHLNIYKLIKYCKLEHFDPFSIKDKESIIC